MARESLPPEHADSWGEFHARLEDELARQRDVLAPLWSAVAGLLFGATLICCAYAFSDRHWWLWVGWLGSFGVVLTMAARAVRRADSRRARMAELARLQDTWQDHLDRGSPRR
jgi:drug/metabolite transporter (DMT)-like permease